MTEVCHPNRAQPPLRYASALSVWMVCLLVFEPTSRGAAAPPQIAALSAPGLWQRLEFRVANIPSALNPFDPDVIRLDTIFSLPSGRMLTVPAFWYQGYGRTLQGTAERLSITGPAEWRVRFTPTEPGDHTVSLSVRTNGQLYHSGAAVSFTVPAGPATGPAGFVRVAASRQYFETTEGAALPLVGANVCWHASRGTYDYDTWFPAMHNAGENFARLWMCPWAFGIEADTNSLTRYRLDRAWQLDYVFSRAEQLNLYLLLCLDYHGMFETEPDTWGGNNLWPRNPYNVVNGGPCATQNEFFAGAAAQVIYQKRLRYLIARYGCSRSLLAWEFFNEIDNVYRHLNTNSVAVWHDSMGGWLKTHDPFGHLVTTSLTGNSDRPEIWSIPAMDFAAYHSYGEPSPATRLASVSQSFLRRYGKPVMVGEFGVDYRGWSQSEAQDPYWRGLRQGIWAGALGGSAGTSMSWWWEQLHTENVYPLFRSLKSVLAPTQWGSGTWTPIGFRTAGPPPATVGEPLSNGVPFAVELKPSGQWGSLPSGELALPDPEVSAYAASTLNCFVHGTAHADLRVPFRLSAWLAGDARMVMHLNSVSSGASLTVRVDGNETYRTNLANLDGGYQVNNEYNLDLPASLPAGHHLVEIRNAGSDWFYLDWVRLENVRPATYAGGWEPSATGIGMRKEDQALLYVIAPGASYPAGATNAILPVQQGKSVTLTNWPAGVFQVRWYNPVTGQPMDVSQSKVTNGVWHLPLPDFREDLAGAIYRRPALTAIGMNSTAHFLFRLDSEPGGEYALQRSSNLVNWAEAFLITNHAGTVELSVPTMGVGSGYIRAERR